MRRPGFLSETRAATAAEFALVLPLMLLFLFGIIDAGMYGWRINEAEKAAQMGARYAVVTAMVASDLSAASYIGNTKCSATLTAGDTICKAALGTLSCGSTGACTATGNNPGTARNAAAFDKIAARVRAIAPWVPVTSIKVEYTGSGLGYAGDPAIAIAPVVTVKLDSLAFKPISGFLFAAAVPLPTISRSLTLEDGKGIKSN